MQSISDIKDNLCMCAESVLKNPATSTFMYQSVIYRSTYKGQLRVFAQKAHLRRR